MGIICRTKSCRSYIFRRGKKQIRANIESYLENAKIIKNGLEDAGFTTYGGVNSPYIWLQVPKGMTSWEFLINY